MASRVQFKPGSGSGNPTLTLDAAPAQGNYLVAFLSVQGSRTLTVASGWEKRKEVVNADTGGFYVKVCGAGESATQTPCTSDSRSAVFTITMVEYNGVPTSTPIEADPDGNNDNDATKTSTGAADPTDNVERIIIGGAFTTSNSTWSDQKVNGSTTGVTELGEPGAGSASNQTGSSMWDKIENPTVSGNYTVEAVASTSGTGAVFIMILNTVAKSLVLDQRRQRDQSLIVR